MIEVPLGGETRLSRSGKHEKLFVLSELFFTLFTEVTSVTQELLKFENDCILFPQAPTARQVKYKEKVQELRKKKDSGLSKEQKEKYMVCSIFSLLSLGVCATRSRLPY